MAEEKKGLSKKNVVGYAFGDLGGCMTFTLMGAMVTRYYTNVLHVNTVILATLLLIWNIWDAVNDPMMGALMDKMFAKHQDARGKFRPWLLRSTPLLAITAVVFWTVPTFFEGTAMLVVLFFCKILYEGMYTMFNIPMGSLLSAMANTDNERAKLSSARGFGSMIGNIIPMMIMPQMLAAWGDTSKAFGIGGAICAAIGFVFCFLHYAWTEERNVSVSSEDAANVKMSDIFGVFKHNRPFVALCIHGIAICTMQYVNSTLGTYMFADVLGNVGLMSAASGIGMVLGLPILIFTPKLAKKFSLEGIIRYGLLISAAMYIVLFGVLSVTMINPWVYIIWTSLGMSFAMISIYMQWGLVGEAIDYNEMVTGKRTEGSIYGTFNLCRRIGQTVGNSAAVLALGWIGYDTVIGQAGGQQSAGAIAGIKVLCLLVPGIFLVISWASFRFVWNIKPETRQQLKAFKEGKGAE